MSQPSLRVETTSDRKAVVQGTENPSLSVLLSLRPSLDDAPRPPVTVVFLLDCSGTVRRFSLGEEEAQRWIDLARERSELRPVASDRREGYEFTGRTLAEVRKVAKCPLAVSAAALERIAAGFRPSDVCCLVGFATKAEILYDGRRRLARQSLREASQLLSKLGENELAERFERQAADVESDRVDSDHTKSLKDWVRRLAQRTDQQE